MKSLKILLATALFLLGAQIAFASMPCEGTVYFKLPDDWKGAYAVSYGQKTVLKKSPYSNWLQASTSDIGGINNADYFFINETGETACFSSGHCARRDSINVPYLMFNSLSTNSFRCSDFGSSGELWIMTHPDPNKEHLTYTSTNPPDVKYLYVYLPQNQPWFNAIPIINEDGKDHELYVDEENCGWYYRRYINEKLPKAVFIHRADDNKHEQVIGFNSEGSEKEIEKIPLSDLFNLFNQDQIYFVANKEAEELPDNNNNGWFETRPAIEGNCSYALSATIYDTDASLHPSFSCYSAGGEGCQTGVAAQGVDTETIIKAINTCIGVTTGIVESSLDSKTKKPKLSTTGKKCFMEEKYFNQLFNYTEGVNEKTFFHMSLSRTSDYQWEFDSDYYTSPGLMIPVMGGFYPAEGKTDATVFAADPKQKPVPAARTKRLAEGPVFWGPALRALDPVTKAQQIDILCKGPGWNGGIKCDGLFGDGETTTEAITSSLNLTPYDCVFGWSCSTTTNAPTGWPMYVDGTETISARESYYRWTSKEDSKNGGRNQHFCFESHAKFKFKNGQKFSIRGDDDIWVFIDNKLAVDLGGTHLAAPGYVDLDYFMPDAKVGSTYDIDIFFCDRRTTMSNMRIKTNLLMFQGDEESIFGTNSSSSKKATSSSSSNKNAKSSSSTSKDSKSSSSNKSGKSSSSASKNAKSSSSSVHYAEPTFRVKMVAPFEFEIVFDDDLPRLAKQYAVMDMKGQVLSVGELSGTDTRIKVPTPGAYMVKVGLGFKQVTVK